jgi:hypothetical protein
MKLLALFILYFSFLSNAEETRPNHELWNKLLKQHVHADGRVNYKKFKKNEAKLLTYIEELQKHTPKDDWTPFETKAYWINTYNAFTIKLVLDYYPVKSIKHIMVDNKSAWNIKWINLNGELYSLNDIENNKLRAKYKDPRIHFLLHCASISCPKFYPKALTGENIEDVLTARTKHFVNDKNENTITPTSILVSELFAWYKDDFGSLISFLNRYSKIQINTDASIEYKPYNWDLND